MIQKILALTCTLALAVIGVAAQSIYTPPDDALIFNAPPGYTIEVEDRETAVAQAAEFGFQIDITRMPLQISLVPNDGFTSNVLVDVYYGQQLQNFVGDFVVDGTDNAETVEAGLSEADPAEILRGIGAAFEGTTPDAITIKTLTLENGSEILYYDYVATVTDEELGNLDLGATMDDLYNDDASQDSSEAMANLFDGAESPFGEGMFESISETTRYYGLSFPNTGPVIIEATIGSEISNPQAGLGGMNDFVASLEGDIPAVMEQFINGISAGEGEPIYIEPTPIADTPTGQQTGGISYVPPAGYAILSVEAGNIVLSNDVNATSSDDSVSPGFVRITIQYGDTLAALGIDPANDPAAAAASLSESTGGTITPITIGAVETTAVTFADGTNTATAYVFDHSDLGTMVITATAEAETLAQAQRDIVLLIVSIE